MQITIDTNVDTTDQIYAIARALMFLSVKVPSPVDERADVVPAFDAHASTVDIAHHAPTAAEIFGRHPEAVSALAKELTQPTVGEALAQYAQPPPNGIVLLPPGVDPTQVVLRDVDASGAPFDPIIHSSAHTKNANGLWKKRRGGPSTPSVPNPVQPPPSVPPAVHIPPPPPPAPGAFRALANRVSVAVESGKITRERVREICVSVGSPDLMTLNAMPHLIPSADAAFTAAGC